MSKEKPAYEERYEEFKKQRDLQHDEQAKNIEAQITKGVLKRVIPKKIM